MIIVLIYLGIINDFLSWGGFAVLSRLTFFMYLIHIDLESMFFASLDYPYEYSDLQMVSLLVRKYIANLV